MTNIIDQDDHNSLSSQQQQDGAASQPDNGHAVTTQETASALVAEESAADSDMVLDLRHVPAVQPGVYKFSDTSVELNRNHATRVGIRDQVVVTFDVELPTGTLPLKQRYIASNYQSSLFNRLVVELVGHTVGKSFDCRELAARSGMLKVVHNTSADGDTFANVEHVWDCVPNRN
ncbi:MAG: hypothetical protein ACYCYO_00010 [Bacilli bacterium]